MASKKEEQEEKKFDEDLIGTMGTNHAHGSRRSKRNTESLGVEESAEVIAKRTERMRGRSNDRRV